MNALIGAGAAAVCGNAFASPEDIQTVLSLFRAVSKAWELEEQYFSILLLLQVALLRMLSYLLIRLPEQPLKWYEQRVGREIATQAAVLGSAQTLANSTENPDFNRPSQFSGGTTVAGIVELENNAFISTVIKGIDTTILRDQELAKQD